MEIAPGMLAPCQQQAIENIRVAALALKSESQSIISHIFRMSNIRESEISQIKDAIKKHARVVLHFHPDRPAGHGAGRRMVAQALLDEGIYKTQFETGISNGLVAMESGGPRDEWERHLFHGAYQMDGVTAAQRPRYGALDLMRNADGPAPRFGSCFFVLNPEVTNRTTLTFGGSQDRPRHQGTATELDAVLAALLEESFTRDFALGVHGVRPPQLVERLISLADRESESNLYETGSASRNLDHVVEAQVHGEVALGRDVEAVVVDAAFRNTEIGQILARMASNYGFSLHYHCGLALPVDQIPADFRGPTMPSLAARVARDNGGVIDTACLGRAVQSLTENPLLWEDRGSFRDVLQEIKLLWHVLVRFGRPLEDVHGGR